MIGDSVVDIQAGIAAGCRTILVLTGKGETSFKNIEKDNIKPDLITENILTAITAIKQQCL